MHKIIVQSVVLLQEVIELAHANDKELMVYISMGFGNLYVSSGIIVSVTPQDILNYKEGDPFVCLGFQNL